MKKLIFLTFCLLIICISAFGQEADTAFNINILKSPQSPGFTILDIAPSQIDRPSNPTDFAVSLANASDNFTSLPKNFAVEFAPAWILSRKKISNEEYLSDKFCQSIWQNTVVSVATATNKTDGADSNSTKLGIGFKITLARGKLDPEFENTVNKIQQKLNTLSSAKAKKRGSDDSLNKLKTERNDKEKKLKEGSSTLSKEEKGKLKTEIDSLDKLIDTKESEIVDEVNQSEAEILQQIKDWALTLDDTRYGFKSDFAGAVAIDYPTGKLDSHEVRKYAFWYLMGYDDKSGWGGFGVFRTSMLPNQRYLNSDSTFHKSFDRYFDLGVKANYDKVPHLSLSFEYLWRFSNLDDNQEHTTRYTFNASYEFVKNKALTFYIGKDFGKGLNESGNLITALNLLLGFGSKRPLANN